ncbi:MAG: adenosylhomocysteinase [Actinomycetales bacterium]|nr:adenosylhomocysteinase [Actinomycetales bacterium]
MTTTDPRIAWVRSSCRLLAAIAEEYRDTRPFAGLTIGTGIHLEPKTAALLETLHDGGAELVSTGNLNSTQQQTVDHLRGRGITVIGGPTADPAVHDRDLREVLDARPDLLLDNGGDLFARYLEDPYEGLRGGTEETTSGRDALLPLRERLRMPVLVINDSPIKQFAENTHAVGQSVFESFLRITNRSTGGKRVVVIGYGSCGRGVAAEFRGSYALVTVVDADPVKRLEANLDGYDVRDREQALRDADIVITITGRAGILTAADLDLLRDDVIVANAGHLPWEIEVDEWRSAAAAVEPSTPGLETLRMADGRRIHLAGAGHMVNLAGPAPLGNSIESMDLGFALQARCLEVIARGDYADEAAGVAACVVPVPRSIDEAVATGYLASVAGVRV